MFASLLQSSVPEFQFYIESPSTQFGVLAILESCRSHLLIPILLKNFNFDMKLLRYFAPTFITWNVSWILITSYICNKCFRFWQLYYVTYNNWYLLSLCSVKYSMPILEMNTVAVSINTVKWMKIKYKQPSCLYYYCIIYITIINSI